MSRRGRFGKYGEIKRLSRLRARPILGTPTLREERPFRGPRIHRELSFREAGEEDKGFIKVLSERLFSGYGDYGDYLPHFIGKEGAMVWIAKRGRRDIGFAIAAPVAPQDLTRFELVAIGILPEYQGKGFGGMLLDHVIKNLTSYGAEEVLLHTGINNKPAQALFVKKGFLPVMLKKDFYGNLLIMLDHLGSPSKVYWNYYQ
ncbi:MAG: GNAT family N-acetyltransferase [Desulfatiglandales bacterium]